jgi:hypothetical protein
MARGGASETWGTIAVVGGVLGAIGLVAALVRSSKTAPSPTKVALIGDSYAVGLGPELQKRIAGLRYEGHVGTTTAQWVSQSTACAPCGSWLSAYAPSIVLVSLGVNDGPTPNPANYQLIVRAIHGIGARAVWIEPPAGVSGAAAIAAAAARSIIESLGVSVIPPTQTPMSADGVHPQSYAPWAQEIASAVA